MNEYEHEFKVRCPIDDTLIKYRLNISSETPIRYESIVDACKVSIALHEDLADELKEVLGGTQTLNAKHNDVWLRTKR